MEFNEETINDENITTPSPPHNNNVIKEVDNSYSVIILAGIALIFSLIGYCFTYKFVLGNNFFETSPSSEHSEIDVTERTLKEEIDIEIDMLGKQSPMNDDIEMISF